MGELLDENLRKCINGIIKLENGCRKIKVMVKYLLR